MRGARFKNIGWRIDYFCLDNKSEDRIINSYILPDIMGSDHCPIGFEFE
jgi:exodeoxyribonuclease-3